MLERRQGKIVGISSASGSKRMPNYSAYGSARGAQLAYVQDVGTEVAPQNVQVNTIAQTFVETRPASRRATRRLTSSRSESRAHHSGG
jgi:2-keto-3-deoxy-L-fuconate dehydrogenase